ncbi:MAG: LytTR family transcriptional regulator DNA-binding domain-containing protein [Spirochaetes bacterium]|nr:LytTR family transcriptional regulator DNA-binding domain-containing protein [Spirochaetota bacterium]
MKTFSDAIEFANRHPVCFLATIDGDRPRVRGLRMWRADESGFYFASPERKNVIRQIEVNPNVEVCFYRHGNVCSDAVMLRVAGRVRFVSEQLPVHRGDGLRRAGPVIFKIIAGEARIWKSSDGLSGERTLLFDINDAAAAPDTDRFLSFTEDEYSYHLDTRNILYCTSSGKHSIIHTETRDYEVTRMLKNIKEMLPHQYFMRIQKRYVVNLAHVDRVEYLAGGRYIAYLNDGDDTVLPVGRNYVMPLKEKIARRVPFVP